MIKGTDIARAMGNQAHADAIDTMKEQLILILVDRLSKGQSTPVEVSIDELDNFPKGKGLMMRLNQATMSFEFFVQEVKYDA